MSQQNVLQANIASASTGTGSSTMVGAAPSSSRSSMSSSASKQQQQQQPQRAQLNHETCSLCGAQFRNRDQLWDHLMDCNYLADWKGII
ncbi:hypothetical protein DL89DRAFT_143330 [Linderina pennispora]|uniref:C2H2-type domain-containing protein n=1 Tax=Linderina pennispora TaxID=61395 RepID=A0A1Y1WBM7_9FUNG|nr:uncharacterized protein DL89DRAFT_143330 [Linderina pennispora]ORX70923.1 hypothetical protein DL89DRAFT_143330 [Linderina pennispora]